jgi:hypothetical protein
MRGQLRHVGKEWRGGARCLYKARRCKVPMQGKAIRGKAPKQGKAPMQGKGRRDKSPKQSKAW